MRSVLALFAVLSLGSAAAAFEPGSIGRATEDTGYLQGCTDEGELPGCTIIAFGSRFVAPADGDTPPEVMAALKAMPPLTYLDFKGDLLDMYDSYAEIAFSSIAPAAVPDLQADTIRAMQGAWVSVDDPQAMVQIDGLIWSDVYGGEALDQSVIGFWDVCADGTAGGGAGPVMELFIIGPMDSGSLCYSGLSVDGDRMEMTYLSRGNTLAFTRAK